MEKMREEIDSRARLWDFDRNKDGEIAAQELEDGLQKVFASYAKTNPSYWTAAETSLANQDLTKRDPYLALIRDWSGDGRVDLDEFAAWYRGLFRRVDKNKDGVVTKAEMEAMPPPPKMPPGGPPGGMPPGGPSGKGGGPPGGGGGMPR